MPSIKNIIIFSFVLLCGTPLFSQIYINEICSSNQISLQTSTGDTPDWIELYNAGEEPVNLQNYYLSDGESNFQKWQFPEVFIPANSFLIVFASDDNGSSDEIHTNFKLSSSGEVLSFSDPTGHLLQQVLTPLLTADISYSRDANGDFFYTTQTTPNAPNNFSALTEPAAQPLFSREEAAFEGSFLLELNCTEPNCNIFFTVDGSNPQENGFQYQEPIYVPETEVIRAYTLAPGFLPSRVATRNYFETTPHDLPVIAVSTEPDNLFDYENGIFELGPDAEPFYPYWGANFWRGTEIPANVEMFTGDFARTANFDIGVTTHGGRGTRTHPQKAIRLLAEHQYGIDKMDFKFFPERENTNFERIVMRNGGGDFNYSHCRDEFLARYLMREGLDLDLSGYQPAAWYVNGKYWGIIAFREKFDGFWVEDNYGIPFDEIDLLEEDTFVLNGDRETFEEDFAFMLDNDLTDDATFAEAAKRFDTNNIADYWIAQTTVLNANWPHNNLKLWRERVPEGRWRYMQFDMDVAMERHPWTAANIDMLADKLEDARYVSHTEIMRALLENENYRNHFINRYADLLNTTFRPEIWSSAVLDMQAEISSEMKRHFKRWDECSECNSFEFWEETAMPEMALFAERRPPLARQFVQDYFNLENQVLLELRTYPEGAGTIKINTITPESLPWDGYYFNGVPVELSITPNAGFTFQHWQSLKTVRSPITESSLRANFTEDDMITAYFSADYQGLNLQIQPNPVVDQTELSFDIERISRTDIRIFSANGKEVKAIFSDELNAGTHYFTIDLAELPVGIYFLKVQTDSDSKTVKVVVL